MKTYITTVSSRKQTSVPSALGLKGGEKLLWEEVDLGGGQMIFQVVVVPEDPVESFCGMAKDMGFGGVDSFLKERRRDRVREGKKHKRLL